MLRDENEMQEKYTSINTPKWTGFYFIPKTIYGGYYPHSTLLPVCVSTQERVSQLVGIHEWTGLPKA
jgi:hypothetical protein